MRHDATFGYRVMLTLLEKTVRLLCATLRVEKVNGAAAFETLSSGTPSVLGFWHGTMIAPWHSFRGRNCAGMISRSKDGEMLAVLLKKWKYKVIRGSSSKGGKEALAAIVDTLKSGLSVGLTPDGPRGPAHEFKPGAVVAAMRAGAPLILLGAAYRKKIRLKSWDAFEIPYPFTRARLVFSEPIYISAEAPREEVSERIAWCGETLRHLQEEAAAF